MGNAVKQTVIIASPDSDGAWTVLGKASSRNIGISFAKALAAKKAKAGFKAPHNILIVYEPSETEGGRTWLRYVSRAIGHDQVVVHKRFRDISHRYTAYLVDAKDLAAAEAKAAARSVFVADTDGVVSKPLVDGMCRHNVRYTDACAPCTASTTSNAMTTGSYAPGELCKHRISYTSNCIHCYRESGKHGTRYSHSGHLYRTARTLRPGDGTTPIVCVHNITIKAFCMFCASLEVEELSMVNKMSNRDGEACTHDVAASDNCAKCFEQAGKKGFIRFGMHTRPEDVKIDSNAFIGYVDSQCQHGIAMNKHCHGCYEKAGNARIRYRSNLPVKGGH